MDMAMPAMFHHVHSPLFSFLPSHDHRAILRHLTPLHMPTRALVEEEANTRRTTRAQGGQTMPMASHVHAMDAH
jgi:hypothetical protein